MNNKDFQMLENALLNSEINIRRKRTITYTD